jgi:hypothetical protein
MLLVVVIVDVGAEVVAIVAILVNVLVVDVHVGLMCVTTPQPRSSGGSGCAAPPEESRGSNGQRAEAPERLSGHTGNQGNCSRPTE